MLADDIEFLSALAGTLPIPEEAARVKQIARRLELSAALDHASSTPMTYAQAIGVVAAKSSALAIRYHGFQWDDEPGIPEKAVEDIAIAEEVMAEAVTPYPAEYRAAITLLESLADKEQ